MDLDQMSLQERLLRLQKIKELAERGDAGEQTAARTILEKQCEKYGITPEQLVSEQVEMRYIYFREKSEEHLVTGIIRSYGLPAYDIFRGDGKKRRKVMCVGVECSAALSVEMQLKAKFYIKLWHKELEKLGTAFRVKHGLFRQSNDTEETSTQDSYTPTEVSELMNMIRGLANDFYKLQEDSKLLK